MLIYICMNCKQVVAGNSKQCDQCNSTNIKCFQFHLRSDYNKQVLSQILDHLERQQQQLKAIKEADEAEH